MIEEEKIKGLLEGPLKDIGYDLVSVKLSGSKEKTLSVVVDRVEAIDLDSIVTVSNLVSALLDEADPIEGAYTLNVSSLGAEKPIALEKLPLYIGAYVNLHLTHPYKGDNIVEGTLLKIEEDTVTLERKEKAKKVEISFPLATVDKARLAIRF